MYVLDFSVSIPAEGIDDNIINGSCEQSTDRVSQAPKFDLFLDIQIHY